MRIHLLDKPISERFGVLCSQTTKPGHFSLVAEHETILLDEKYIKPIRVTPSNNKNGLMKKCRAMIWS